MNRAVRSVVVALAAPVVVSLLSACSGSSSGATTAASPAAATSPASSTAAPSASSTDASMSASMSAMPSTSASGPASGTPSVGASAGSVVAAAASGTDVYAGAVAGHLTGAALKAKSLVYVPNTTSNTVSVIDPTTFKVIRTFAVGRLPQHVVPSWDLKTLWVNDNAGDSLVPINPETGLPGKAISVIDPYNLYFTPDGTHAMVMAEKLHRIDFRDPHTMKLQHTLNVPCKGVNHADFTADGRAFLASCEFSGNLIVVPADGSKVIKTLNLNTAKSPGGTDPMAAMRRGGPAANVEPGGSSMPQDVRLAPDGRTFLAADMLRGGLWEIDAATFTIRGFLPTGAGAHGIYPSRDSKRIYVSNRDEGTISVLDAATLKVTAKWKIPGGGSPDMGGVSADGSQLWMSGRYNNVVYVFNTTTGALIHKIPVGGGPHGLAVWPQPGTYSLGHTGNMR